jgi:hypothetical protein
MHGNKLLEGALNGWTISGITTWQAGGNLQANSSQNLGLTIQNTTLNHTIGSSTYFGTPVQTVLPILTCNPTSGLKSNQKINLDCFSAPQLRSQGIRQASSRGSSILIRTPVSTRHSHPTNATRFNSEHRALLAQSPLPDSSSTDPSRSNCRPLTTTPSRLGEQFEQGITDTKFGRRCTVCAQVQLLNTAPMPL